MGRARYNTGLFPLPDNVLPVQLFGGTSLQESGSLLIEDSSTFRKLLSVLYPIAFREYRWRQ